MPHITDDNQLQHFRPLGKPVLPEHAGHRLDGYLAEHFLFYSRNLWKERIRQQEVLVNHHTVRPAYRLKPYDQVAYFRPASKEPEVNTDIHILWEYKGVMAVYKPSNLPMHEAGAYKKHTFFELAKEHIHPECFAIHRLDRETSGIVLCSTDKRLRNHLSASLRDRHMQKTYYAFVKGTSATQPWTVDQPIGDAKQSLLRQKKAVEPDGLAAFTEFRTLEQKGPYSWLEVSPKTGRTHQIRVHAAWSGLPLIGDKKYTPDESVYLEYLNQGFTPRVQSHVLIDRLCLHATAIQFTHPTTQELCHIHCPLPTDMANFWDNLGSATWMGVGGSKHHMETWPKE